MNDREVVLVTGIYAVVIALIAAVVLLLGAGVAGRNEADRDGGVSHGVSFASPTTRGNA